MDRSWVHGNAFTLVYMDGVKEFMSFVKGKFSDNVKSFAHAVDASMRIPKPGSCEQTHAHEWHGQYLY
jgi:hypothetical protein